MNCFIGLLLFLLPILTSGSFRIVGGGLIDITRAPYQVYLINDVTSTFCGGAIINKRTIITAAHCVNNLTFPRQITVRVGSNNPQERGTPLCQPIKVIQHPNYDDQNTKNDIAIIVLENELVYTRSVQSANLPRRMTKLKKGTIGVVTGWGYTIPSTLSSSPLLKFAEFKTLSQKNCEDIVQNGSPSRDVVRNSFFCAVAAKNNIDTACNGDSGGPFVVRGGTVEGIVSWGWQCDSNYPIIFTRVAYYLDFINTNSG